MSIQRVSILGKILFMLAASSFASSQDATPFRFHGDKGPAHKIISQEWERSCAWKHEKKQVGVFLKIRL